MIDGRLLGPAASVWLGSGLASAALGLAETLVRRHEGAVIAVRVSAAVLLAIAIAGVLIRRRRERAVAALVCIAGATLGVLAAAIHIAALTTAPVGAWVDARATAAVRGVIVTEPLTRVLATSVGWQSTVRLEARLATTLVTARGTSIAADLPIILRLPADTEVPPPGSEVEIVGRLGSVPWRLDSAAALTVADSAVILVRTSPGPVDVVAHAMRVGMRGAVAELPADAGSLVAGLAIGDESGQSQELADAMRASGLSHLTAVSGGNVAIVLVVVLAAAALLRLGLVGRAAAGLAAIGFFVVLVGPQPSVLRAGVMGGVVVLGVIAGGRRAGPSVLAASIIVLVMTAPTLAVSWAFGLSVFATGGLILLAPRLQERLATWSCTRGWPVALREALGLTAAAQLATLPVLIAMGGATGWVALPANLLAMPAVAPITVLGLAAACLSPLAGTPAAALAQVAAWPAAWISHVAYAAADLPLSSLTWPTGALGAGALLTVMPVAWLARRLVLRHWPDGVPAPVRLAGALIVLGVVVGCVVLPPDRRGWPPPGWFMIVCDVGQGDAILLRSGDNGAVVVDTGPDPDLIDECLDDAEIDSVPAVVLTHFHADHVAGLSGVFRGRSVARVLVSPVRDPADQATTVDRLLSSLGMRATPISAGDARTVGYVAWKAVWPRRVIASGSIPNNASVVLIATVAGHRILLSGDTEPEAQAAVSTDLARERFDVVKVPHHGSRYQHPMLTTWAPAPIALISVGQGNGYGHPAAETIQAWRVIGAIVGRTDLQGDLAVVSVGSGVGVVGRSGVLGPLAAPAGPPPD